MSAADFAGAVELSIGEVERLLAGELSITVSLARRLADVVGATTTFWLAREAQFQEDLERVVADQWAEELPTKQMASFGWIKKPETWQERINVCLDFFDVADVAGWEARYDRQVVSTHYRTSSYYDLEPVPTTAWFRAAERQVESRPPIPEFNARAFSDALPALRHLTRERNPDIFVPGLIQRSAECGVHVVVVPAPSGCPASGASRMHSGRPLIQLSARYLADDHFWFTFFHEAGHVVNHPLDQGFIDILETNHDDRFEAEANDFASECLLGPSAVQIREACQRHWSHRDVVREALELGIAPGILVGQLQNSGVLPKNFLNGLKRRFEWEGSRLRLRPRQ